MLVKSLSNQVTLFAHLGQPRTHKTWLYNDKNKAAAVLCSSRTVALFKQCGKRAISWKTPRCRSILNYIWVDRAPNAPSTAVHTRKLGHQPMVGCSPYVDMPTMSANHAWMLLSTTWHQALACHFHTNDQLRGKQEHVSARTCDHLSSFTPRSRFGGGSE